MTIEWIQDRIRGEEYELSAHGEQERQADQIPIEELEHALIFGEILEDYPDDPRGHSCLVLGYARQGYPIHTVCGRTPSGDVRLITVYIPTLPKWLDERTRRPSP